MLYEESEKRQKALEECLYKMSIKVLDEQEISSLIEELKNIYQEDFRHSYNRFFAIVIDVGKEDNEYDLESLASNLQTLVATLDGCCKNSRLEISLYNHLRKLSDHLNLEIARYNFYSGYDMRFQNLDKKIISSSQELRTSVDLLRTTQDKIKSDNKKIEREYITILAIFSSIVIAFVGGINYSGEVLAAINNASIYRLLLIIDGLAFVLLNLVNILVDMIFKINSIETDIPIRNINKYLIGIAIAILITKAFALQSLLVYVSQYLPWYKF